MIPFSLLLDHLFAFVVVWIVVLLPGVPLATLARLRYGLPGWLLLGIVYWSVSLYVFPFTGGLLVAMILAALAFVWVTAQHGPTWSQRRWCWRRSNVLLVIGCGVYTTLFLWNYVPIGADASMVTTYQRFIAAEYGLPRSYAPWFPDMFFPSVNLGLSALGSIAMMSGCEPGSIVLALAVLSYTSWILAVYLGLHVWVRPTPAAVLAIAQAWGSRWAQNTIGWGGFTSIASLAVAVFATRVLWDLARRPRWRTAIVLGLSVGAAPLVHGISAAVWLYAVAPVMGISVAAQAHQRRRAFGTIVLARLVSVGVLACYLTVGQFALSPREIQWTQEYMLLPDLAHEDGYGGFPTAARFLIRFNGSLIAYLGLAALGCLLLLRRWSTAMALAACWGLLVVLLVNARSWVLPGSMLLYADRIVYWVSPLMACASALVWQTVRCRWPSRWVLRSGVVVAFVLLAVTFTQHKRHYQNIVFLQAITADEWEALQWAKQNLQTPGTLVRSEYGTVALYLPGIANVATDAWHFHHCLADEIKLYVNTRPATHYLYVRGVNPPPPNAQIVFQNATVTIAEATRK